MSPSVNWGSSNDGDSNTLQDPGRMTGSGGEDRLLDMTVGLGATWGTHLEVQGGKCSLGMRVNPHNGLFQAQQLYLDLSAFPLETPLSLV